MKKSRTRLFVTFLSFALVLAGTLTASATELLEQWREESVSSENILVQELSVTCSSDPLFIKGNGVRLKRTPGTSGYILSNSI